MQRHDCLVLGEKIWFCVATGVVKGLRIWSETQVYGSGGGGTVGPYGGYLAPVSVTSTTTTRREFWIVEDNGAEHRIVYDEGGFSVRDGQRVQLLWGASASQNSGPYLCLSNPSFRQNYAYYLLTDSNAVLERMGLGKKGSYGLAGLIVFVATTILMWKVVAVASIFLDIFSALIITLIVGLVGRSIRNQWFEEIMRAARQCMSPGAEITASYRDPGKTFNKTILAVLIGCVIVFGGPLLVFRVTQFGKAIPSRIQSAIDAYKEPQGKGIFRNHFYTAAEIKEYYQVPWKRKKPVKLIGNHITITGDLDGVDIMGMGDMVFNGDLSNSKVTDYFGLITVHDVTNSTLAGNDIKITGIAVNTQKIIDGYFPGRRSRETLSSGLPQHNR